MKKILLPAIAFFALFATSTFAQNTARCSSEDYMSQQLALHPEQAAERAAVDQQAAQFEQQHPTGYNARTVLVVPVVFHVVYNTAGQNVSTQRILEQIQVLNEDYSKTNADASLVPAAFQAAAASCDIQFCLAKHDPSGNWTDGIERVSTTVTSWSMNDNVKFSSSGGADSWDNLNYLNIWICNLTQPSGILAYSTFPGVGAGNLDGVVCNFKYVGKTGATAPFNKGRTLTHEIGHYFNMRHIWGDDNGACTGSDLVSDTPNQASENYGTPAFPHTDACTTTSPGVMFMDYMDYVDDGAMFMFTAGQKTRMWSAINNNRSQLLSSTGCMVTSVSEVVLKNAFTIFPSPTTGAFSLDFGDARPVNFDVSVYNVLGESIYHRHIDALNESEIHLDLMGNPSGIYFVEVRNSKERVTKKIVLE